MIRPTWICIVFIIAGAFLLSGCLPLAPTGVWPRFAYVANLSDDGNGTISIYTVDAFSGQLRHNGYVGPGTTPFFPTSLTADSAGQLLYVVNNNPSELRVYRIDSASGNLLPLSTTSIDPWAFSVAVDPLRVFVYVAHSAGLLSAYSVNSTTGSLTSVPGSPFATGPLPISVGVHPSGMFVYVVNSESSRSASNNISAFRVDRTTGSLTPVGSPLAVERFPRKITIDPLGTFVFLPNSEMISVYRVDGATGALTNRQDTPSGGIPTSVAVDPLGNFVYVTHQYTRDVSAYALDRTTGMMTEIPPRVATGSVPGSVTVDPSGQYAFVVNIGSNDLSIYSIDPTTGALAPKGTVRGRQQPQAIAMTKGPNPITYIPQFAYVAGYSKVWGYRIDPTTGILTQVGTGGSGSALFSVAAYPPGQFAYAAGPFGRFAYSANWGSNNVLVLQIDPTSGALTLSTTISTGTGPSSVVAEPAGRFAYAVSGTSNEVWELNSHSGPVGVTGAWPRSVAVDPTGQFMYVANYLSSNIAIYRINPASGDLTVLGGIAAGPAPLDVAVHPSGRFAFVTDGFVTDAGIRTYAIDPRLGTLDLMSTVSGGGKIAVDPSGQFAYVLGNTQVPGTFASICVYRIDPTTGALSGVPPCQSIPYNPGAVTVDPSGRFVYVASFGSPDVFVFVIDPTTGSLTLVGTSRAQSNSRSVTIVGTIK